MRRLTTTTVTLTSRFAFTHRASSVVTSSLRMRSVAWRLPGGILKSTRWVALRNCSLIAGVLGSHGHMSQSYVVRPSLILCLPLLLGAATAASRDVCLLTADRLSQQEGQGGGGVVEHDDGAISINL